MWHFSTPYTKEVGASKIVTFATVRPSAGSNCALAVLHDQLVLPDFLDVDHLKVGIGLLLFPEPNPRNGETHKAACHQTTACYHERVLSLNEPWNTGSVL